ncbi:MAG: hypothetical protein JO053_08785 [Acidobacteria bacterium]|nr:hypothetical protein [Acidobacteriota bacterium]
MGHAPHVHVGGHGESSGTGRFELIAAIILGVAGIFTALASFQAGLWNGKMSQFYSEANQLSVSAAAEESRAIIDMSKDAAVDVQAKQQILESKGNPAASEKVKQVAGYLYVYQMSEEGYKALGFPEEIRSLVKSNKDLTPAEEKELDTKLSQMIQHAWETDLGMKPEYRTAMLEKSTEQQSESQKTFRDGVESKESADHFELADVIFAVSLFFTGISLVFHTKIRWMILIAGALFLIAGIVYMLTIKWTFA